MSVGTLLAYTIVSASVIILRYKTTQHDKDESKGDDDISVSTASLHSDNLFLTQAGKLKPEFWWLAPTVNGCGHNSIIAGSVLVFITCSAVLCAHFHFSAAEILTGEWWAILILVILIVSALGCLLVIGAHKQNPSTNTFRVPWVPFVPGLSILFNVGLMVHLNILTWVRFTIWMALGLLVYFLYGMKHSKEGNQANTLSMLITSSEANKETWGTMNPRDCTTECKNSNTQSENRMALGKKFMGHAQKKEDKIALTADQDSEQ